MYVNFDNDYRTVETLEIMEDESLDAFFARISVWLYENAAFYSIRSMSADFEDEFLEIIAYAAGIELD